MSASSAAGFSRSTAALTGQKSDVTRPQRALDAHLTPLSQQAIATSSTVPATAVRSYADQFAATASKLESGVITGLQDNTNLISIFGRYQRLSGRTVVEDMDAGYTVMKLGRGTDLTFVRDTDLTDVEKYAADLARLRDELEEEDIPLLYIQAPQKLAEGDEEALLPLGTYDNRNQGATLLLEKLEEADIDTLDLRPVLRQSGGDWYDWFYRTDHHWRPEAAFVSFRAIAEKLENYYQTTSASYGTKREKIKLDEKYLDPDNYEKVTLENFFLGSQGKRVGYGYVGADDFDLITPKFATLMHYSYSGNDRYGTAEETVLFPERVETKDYYNGNPYTYYAGGDYPFARVTNYYNPDGPKLLLLRDSYACPLLPFLSYACSEVATIDLRYFDAGQLMTYVRWVGPDVVMVMYSTSTISTPALYQFYPEVPESKADSLTDMDKLLPEHVHKENE